jgi:hypothetical protein
LGWTLALAGHALVSSRSSNTATSSP